MPFVLVGGFVATPDDDLLKIQHQLEQLHLDPELLLLMPRRSSLWALSELMVSSLAELPLCSFQDELSWLHMRRRQATLDPELFCGLCGNWCAARHRLSVDHQQHIHHYGHRDRALRAKHEPVHENEQDADDHQGAALAVPAFRAGCAPILCFSGRSSSCGQSICCWMSPVRAVRILEP